MHDLDVRQRVNNGAASRDYASLIERIGDAASGRDLLGPKRRRSRRVASRAGRVVAVVDPHFT